MICPNCGSEIESGAKFCSVCGTKLTEDTPAVSVNKAVPEVEIPTPKAPEKPKIELVLPGHEMYEQMEEEEEDLSDILNPHGVETHGNMQAQTTPKIDLVLPDETPQQMQARLELERERRALEKQREAEEMKRRQEAEAQARKEQAEAEKLSREELRKQREREMSQASRKEEGYGSVHRTDEEKTNTARPAYAQAERTPTKLWAVMAYMFSWIGVALSFFMTREGRTELESNHLNNAFWLALAGIIATRIDLGIISFALDVVILVLWVMGLLAAVRGEEKDLPVVEQLPKIF